MNGSRDTLCQSADQKTLLTRLATRMSDARGWRGAFLTVLLGVIAAAAMPPIHLLPALFAFAILAWRLERMDTWRGAALSGWLFGFGYHVAGLYWISNAMLVESERFAWAVPFAAAGLPMLLACYPAIVIAAMSRLFRPGWIGGCTLAAAWGIAEYARGYLLTGFPWNLTAYALTFSDAMMQAASVFGAHGLSLTILFFAIAPAVAIGPGRNPTLIGLSVAAFCFFIPAALWFYGTWRLSSTEIEFDRAIVVRIVQANIPQREKWQREHQARHLARYMKLSDQSVATHRAENLSADSRPTVVIWPETAVPAFLNMNRNLRSELARSAPQAGALVTGTVSLDEGDRTRVYNSLLAMDNTGSIQGRYDKSHLVPFGEYLPLRDWIVLPNVVGGFTNFSAGPGLVTMNIAGIGLVSPLICYEVIFPGRVVTDSGGGRPIALLNLTNDAWYGHSSGPYQHLAIARMRAIEEGLPLIRAANTGISGLYDAYGRTVVQIGLEEIGVADSMLPASLKRYTVFSQLKDGVFFLLIILAFFVAGFLPK